MSVNLHLGDCLDVMRTLKAPFPYFGGKSRIAPLVWSRFGTVRNYVEPFAGSLANLLARPTPFVGTETVNDYCGYIANFWRAVRHDPDAVADAADWPVNENDLHARHAWLTAQKEMLRARLEGDPEWFDAKVAGWWVYCQCLWIGSGLCSGKGPWNVVDGMLVNAKANAGRGVNRKCVHMGNAGQGVNRQLVHLRSAGRGVNRKCDDAGTCADWSAHLRAVMGQLSDRLRRVRVCCGDWSRVCGPTPTVKQGLTAVFLDPPYADSADRVNDLYTEDSLTVAHKVREWAIERGNDKRMRIALCGYEGEHTMPADWECVAWKAKGGYASQRKSQDQVNSKRERVWFSPHCLKGA